MPYVLPVYEYRTPPEIRRKKAFSYEVVVVGAGFAGLTAALELGSRGVRTVVLDEDDTVGAQGLSSRGICHAKRSLEIFDRSGVAERIRAKGVTWNEGEVYRGSERLYRFNLQPEADQKFPAFVNLQQFYVEQYLVERLQQMPEVDLRWKNKVLQVEEDAEGMAVTVTTPDGEYAAKAKYLLAADRAHSVVRAQLGAKDAESELLESVWCIADVRMAGETDAVRKSYLDSPLNAGGAIWYHQMADGVTSNRLSTGSAGTSLLIWQDQVLQRPTAAAARASSSSAWARISASCTSGRRGRRSNSRVLRSGRSPCSPATASGTGPPTCSAPTATCSRAAPASMSSLRGRPSRKSFHIESTRGESSPCQPVLQD